MLVTMVCLQSTLIDGFVFLLEMYPYIPLSIPPTMRVAILESVSTVEPFIPGRKYKVSMN
jgi:hypothetical protein